tara:strand:+ start:2779 stop:3513 length:735 start_codon:yes stop_codon:yes gene_type:complete
MKVLITGGNGILAQELLKSKRDEDEVICKGKKELDVSIHREVYDKLVEICTCKKLDVIIHCAALTDPMVVHEDKPILSTTHNIIGTANVAMLCAAIGIKMVYISTDYVYTNSNSFNKETDTAIPFTKYGWSKLGGECAVNMLDDHLILRCSHTLKPFKHKKAFRDVFKSNIYVDEIAPIIWKAIHANGVGTYNVGGRRSSIYDFAIKENPRMDTIYRKDVDNSKIPNDTSMSMDKLRSLLKEKL